MTTSTGRPDPARIAETRHPVPRQPTATVAADPRKALYLDGRARPIDVRALGPALAITRGEARVSLPLARLARIVCCGRVHWDGAALALCLQRGLPIVFLDGRARPLGAAAPITGRSSTLDELLSTWVERTHWREGFDNWLRAQRFRLLRQWARTRLEHGRPVDGAAWKEAVRTFVYVDDTPAAEPNPGGCYALVVSLLLRAGVRLQYRAPDGGVLPLAAELGRMADRRLALGLGTLAAAFGGLDGMATRALECDTEELERYLADLLARLRRSLADHIEPCP